MTGLDFLRKISDGSDSPPDCHSLPSVKSSRYQKTTKKGPHEEVLFGGAVPVVKSEPIGEACTSSRDVVFALFSNRLTLGVVGGSPAPCTYVNKYEGTYLWYKPLVCF